MGDTFWSSGIFEILSLTSGWVIGRMPSGFGGYCCSPVSSVAGNLEIVPESFARLDERLFIFIDDLISMMPKVSNKEISNVFTDEKIVITMQRISISTTLVITLTYLSNLISILDDLGRDRYFWHYNSELTSFSWGSSAPPTSTSIGESPCLLQLSYLKMKGSWSEN